MVFRVFIFIFLCLELTIRKEHKGEKNHCHCYGTFFESAESFFSTVKRQLKILQKWVNIGGNSFLVKHHESKIEECARKTNSYTKIQVSS